jgi:mandelamide amidase
MITRTLADWRALSPEQRRVALDETRTAALASAGTGVFISIAEADSLTEGGDGVLAGTPIAVKDNIDVAGLSTTGGTDYLDYSPDVNADVVTALRSEGAVVVGKTNLHELAFGLTSNNGAHGPVRNPFDPSLSAGGSSGGSAAVVARGIVPVAIGTDTGGSMSVPASFCGVFGIRPTTGRYPSDGIIGLSWTRDTAGLFATNVSDLRFVDEIITGEGDTAADIKPKEIRVGVSDAYLADLEATVGARFDEAVVALRGAGVHIVPVNLVDHFERTAVSNMTVVLFETPHTLVSYLRGTGLAGLPADLLAASELTKSPDVAGVLAYIHGNPVPVVDYQRAAANRWQLRRQFISQLDDAGVHAIAFPTVPILPPPLGQDAEVELNGSVRSLFDTLTRLTSPGALMGMPMVTIPTGDPKAVPVGITIMGRPFDDREVLKIADTFSEILRPSGDRSQSGGTLQT